MKVIQVISEHKQPKSKGQVEAIVKLDDGRLVTRHMNLSKDEFLVANPRKGNSNDCPPPIPVVSA